MSPVLHVVSRRTNRDFGRDDGTTRHLAPCQPINRVFGVRLSVSMVVSLGRLVDRGVLEAARACGEAASSVPRGPPCHAVLSSNGLWHCIPEYPQRLLIHHTSVSLQLHSGLQSTSYKSLPCLRTTPNNDTHPLVARPSRPPLLPFFARLRQTCEPRSSSSAGRGDLLPSCLLHPFPRGPSPRGPFPRRCSALRI